MASSASGKFSVRIAIRDQDRKLLGRAGDVQIASRNIKLDLISANGAVSKPHCKKEN